MLTVRRAVEEDLPLVRRCSNNDEPFPIPLPARDSANSVQSAVGPCLIAAGANAYYLWNAHWDHWNHMPPLEERTEYPYQNIRTKNYMWGDGDKVSCIRESEEVPANIVFRPSCKSSNHPIKPIASPFEELMKLTAVDSWNTEVNYHNKDKVA